MPPWLHPTPTPSHGYGSRAAPAGLGGKVARAQLKLGGDKLSHTNHHH